MGTVISRDTRRISFENSLALNPAVLVEKSIEDQNTLMLNDIESESDELTFEEKVPCKELQDDELKYWSGRIESLKNEHQIIAKIIEEEYEKTIDNTIKLNEQRKITQDHIKKIKPCYAWRAKMLQCYENNPHQSLVCSPVVQEFNEYVESCRVAE
ncbi:unnamed protein product, partial [Iphiclides podalirius]